MRSNLCLWGEPKAYSGIGRPKKHGAKFQLNEPATWGEVASILEENDPKLGRVRISLWKNLHFRKAATRPMLVLRVERLDAQGNLRVSKPLWLAWVGEEMPTLEEVWRLYLRRFTIDHWYRFLKQRLHWTVPKLSTPKQCELEFRGCLKSLNCYSPGGERNRGNERQNPHDKGLKPQ